MGSGKGVVVLNNRVRAVLPVMEPHGTARHGHVVEMQDLGSWAPSEHPSPSAESLKPETCKPRY